MRLRLLRPALAVDGVAGDVALRQVDSLLYAPLMMVADPLAHALCQASLADCVASGFDLVFAVVAVHAIIIGPL